MYMCVHKESEINTFDKNLWEKMILSEYFVIFKKNINVQVDLFSLS